MLGHQGSWSDLDARASKNISPQVIVMGSSSVNRRLVVAFCITLYCWFAFLDEKDGLDPEQVGFVDLEIFVDSYSSLSRIVATSLSLWNRTKRSWEKCKLLADNRCIKRNCWLGNFGGDFGGWCWQCHPLTIIEDDVNLAESVILMRMMTLTAQDWRGQQVLVSKPDLICRELASRLKIEERLCTKNLLSWKNTNNF